MDTNFTKLVTNTPMHDVMVEHLDHLENKINMEFPPPMRESLEALFMHGAISAWIFMNASAVKEDTSSIRVLNKELTDYINTHKKEKQ